MAIIDEFIKKAGEFYGELKVQDRHRYCSWEHCYAQFYEARQNPEKPNVDNLSLHLAFYLASWGMYRGSSFLLQYDYTIHTFVVEEILKQSFIFQIATSKRNLSKKMTALLAFKNFF